MEPRNKLKQKYSEMVRAGHLVAARSILRLLHTGSFFISDGNNALYQSGLADWLMENFRYGNRTKGFEVYARFN